MTRDDPDERSALGERGPFRGDDPAIVEMVERDILDVKLGVTFDDIAALDTAKRLLNEAVVLPLLVPEFFTGIREVRKAGGCGSFRRLFLPSLPAISSCRLILSHLPHVSSCQPANSLSPVST